RPAAAAGRVPAGPGEGRRVRPVRERVPERHGPDGRHVPAGLPRSLRARAFRLHPSGPGPPPSGGPGPDRITLPLTARRLRVIGAALDEVRARCDVASRMANDPVEIVHRYERPLDRELVALVASSFAFGNVKAFRPKIE